MLVTPLLRQWCWERMGDPSLNPHEALNRCEERPSDANLIAWAAAKPDSELALMRGMGAGNIRLVRELSGETPRVCPCCRRPFDS
jgi:hypothetical protein